MISQRFFKQQGYFIVVAVLFIFVIAGMGTIVAHLATRRADLSLQQENGLQAFYNAESGLQIGTRLLYVPTNPLSSNRYGCNELTGLSAITNATFNGGQLTVSSVGSAPTWDVTTLSSSLTASATTISVTSTTGFASQGRITIDSEAINYDAISGNTFINATRGAGGTTAVSHASGAGAGQYQCTLDAIAGIPNLTSPTSRREIQQVVQLPFALILGNVSGSTCPEAFFNYPTETAWTNRSLTSCSAGNIMHAYLLSNADGWAVGAPISSNLSLFRFSGSSVWTLYTPTVAVNAQLNGVFCNASNDCWAVGAASSSNPVIERWNGSTWSRVTPTVSVNTRLNSVTCNSSSDCWAVGAANSNTPLIERWNGTNWSRVTPTATANAALNSVFCNSSTDCWAVGAAVNSNPLIERWNGTNWSRVTPAVSVNIGLNGVYCPASNDCWAVGNQSGTNPLIEHWNGTNWTAVTPSSTRSIDLFEVSCFSASDCWAVGETATFAHYDGSTWAYVTAPSGLPSVTLNTIATVPLGNKGLLPTSSWTQVYV